MLTFSWNQGTIDSLVLDDPAFPKLAVRFPSPAQICLDDLSPNHQYIQRLSISTRLLNRRIELEAGGFYPLGNLDGCLTVSIVLSSWHGLQTLLIERLPTTRALAISTIFNSAQGFINFFDDL
jgi:hypothetical protein